VVDAVRVVRLPDDVPFDTAAGLLMAYGTALHALKQRGQVRPGESVLVLGAAGGVGLAAVELAHAMGARVIAGASSAKSWRLPAATAPMC
jgi:NADPH2:quinone reductase